MDKRTVLAIVLSFLVLVLYQWGFAPKPKNSTVPAAQQKNEQRQNATQQNVTRQNTAQQNIVQQNVRSFHTRKRNNKKANIIYASMPFYTAELSTNNLAVIHWYLKDYRVKLNKKSPSVDLIGNVPGIVYPMWESFDGSSFTLPSTINYVCSKFTVTVKSEKDNAHIACSYRYRSIGIKKIITFYGNSYTATVTIKLKNNSSKPIIERLGVNWSGLSGELGSRYNIADGLMLINTSRETIKAKSLKLSKSYNGLIQWFGLENLYFIQLIIPHEPVASHLYATRTKGTVSNGLIPLLLTYVYNPIKIKPHSGSAITYSVFLGPKDIDVLDKAGSNLKRALYFGWSDIIAKPFFYILKYINNYIGNYGWTIVILTILIRILMFPLGQIGYKSMRQMQKIAPKINELKEKYKNDKQRLYLEQRNLYKSYKINPMGGCLPMLLQLPVFLALYEVLLMAIELRHAPFLLWINDLSAPDTIATISLMGTPIALHILPLIMGATMFFQQKLTPTTMGDPKQAKIMLWAMPIVLTVLFWSFPAGLVLYWTVNNIFSIGQQYYILKKY